MKKLFMVLAVGVIMLGGAAVPAQTVNIPPTISDMPSPVVANDTPVSGAGIFGHFVYMDAMDLDKLATDDLMPASSLMWTYIGSLAGGGSNYRINGVSPINVARTDPTSPNTAMIINRNDNDLYSISDKLAHTITIRNNHLSPLSGSGGSLPSSNGIVASETEPVTFFCSDGNAFSSQTVFFYTGNNESDRLSGSPPPVIWPPDPIRKFWRSTEWNALGSTGTNFQLTTSTVPGLGTGVCLVAGQRGQNWGSLVSAYPYFNLAANQVYQIKLKMSGSQVTGGKTPYWDLILENYDDLHPNTLNLYVFTTGFYDEQGGANALTTTPRTVTLYWAPPALSTPQWNDPMTGAFTSTRDAINDPRLRFRTMDVDGYGQGELRSGALCIQEIELSSARLSRCQTVQSLVNITRFADARIASNTGKNVVFEGLLGSMAIFSGGTVTISPSIAGQEAELTILRPSTDGLFTYDPRNPSDYDEYPIMWKTGKILRMQADLSAPTRVDEDYPWDAICFLLLSFSNEVNAESYITSNLKCGSPRMGTPQTFTAFFSTHNETQSPIAGYHRLRWELRFLNSPTANFPTGQSRNAGSVRVHGFRVDEVIFN